MAQPATNRRTVQFGLFELDLEARELRKSGVRIKLQEQPFQILALLLDRPGAIVTREELQKKLWPGDTFVDFDLSLNSAVKKLRQALSDDSENPRFVETLYRRGYRFIAPVNGASNHDQIQLVESGSAATAAPASPIPIHAPSKLFRWRRILTLAGIPLLLLLGLLAYRLIPPPQPIVLGFTQITHDGLSKGGIVSDGQRLYFTELQGDHFGVGQVSVAGGETSVLPTPFENVGVYGLAFFTERTREVNSGRCLCPVERRGDWATSSPTPRPGHRMGASCFSAWDTMSTLRRAMPRMLES
jgi:DNA-binding winged helix-turn-helix (wHTH) protein